MKTLFILFASISFAQELAKPPVIPDSLKAEYFAAESAEKSSRANHDALMENFKKALSESIVAQIQATLKTLIANSNLQTTCAEFKMDLDQKALQSGEVKCVARVEKNK